MVACYQTQFTPPDFETDVRFEWKLSYLLSHLQEIAAEHLEALGCSPQELVKRESVFLLSKVALRVRRYPQYGQPVEMATWAPGPQGAAFVRCSTGKTEEGELLFDCDTRWMLVNPNTRKILRPQSFFLPFPPYREGRVEAQVEKLENPGKGEPAPPWQFCGEQEIRYSHLDCNNHVNNARYVDFLYDFGLGENPLGWRVRELQLHFIREALLGDCLTFYRRREGDTLWLRAQRGEECCLQAKAVLEPVT